MYWFNGLSNNLRGQLGYNCGHIALVTLQGRIWGGGKGIFETRGGVWEGIYPPIEDLGGGITPPWKNQEGETSPPES